MRLIAVLLGIAVVCAVSTSRGSGQRPPRYTAAAISQLTSSCASAMVGAMGPRKASALCSCVVQKLQASARYEDAVAFFAAINDRGHPMPTPAIVRFLNACRNAAGF
jgi:hypothetical protein